MAHDPVAADRVLAEVPVHELFDELDTLELPESSVGVDVAVERHADRPGLGERLRVVDLRFVHDVVAADHRVPLGHGGSEPGEVARTIEPRVAEHPVHTHDERVAVPLTE